MKNNPIPSDHSTWATFTKLNAANEDALHMILEESAKDKSAAPGSNRQKIGDFYASCMDESQIEAVGREAARSGVPANRGDQGHSQPASGNCASAAHRRQRGFRIRLFTGF